MLVDAEMIWAFVAKLGKEFPGNEELIAEIIPPNVKDPELLMRAVLRHIFAIFQTFRTRVQVAETEARKAEGSVTVLEFAQAESDGHQREMRKTMDKSMDRVRELEERIAFLGTRWEALTGGINDMTTEKNPHVRIKELHHDAVKCKEQVFDLELINRRLLRERNCVKESLRDLEASTLKVQEELVDRRYKDQASANTIYLLQTRITDLTAELEKVTTQKQAADLAVTDLTTRLGQTSEFAKEKAKLSEKLGKGLNMAHREIGSLDAHWKETEGQVVKGNKEKADVNNILQEVMVSEKRLQAELVAMSKKLGHREDVIVILEKNLDRATADLAAAKQGRKDFENSLAKATSELRESNTGVEEGLREAAVLRTSVNNISRSLTVEHDAYVGKVAELDAARKQLEEARQESSTLRHEAGAAAQERKAAEGDFRSKRSEALNSKRQVQTLSSDIRETKTHMKTLEASAEERGELVRRLQEDLLTRNVELDASESKSAATARELAIVSKQLERSEAEGKKQATELAAAVGRVDTLGVQVKATGREVTLLNSGIRHSEAKARRFEADVGEISETSAKAMADLHAAREDARVAKARAATLESELSSVKEKLSKTEELKAEYLASRDETAKRLARAKEAESTTHKEAIRAGSDLQQSKKLVDKEHGEAETVRQVYVKLASDNKALLENHNVVVTQVSKLQAALDTARSELAVARRKIGEAEEHLERVVDEFTTTKCLSKIAGAHAKDFMLKARNAQAHLSTRTVELDRSEKGRVDMCKGYTEQENRVKAAEAEIKALKAELVDARSTAKRLEYLDDFRDGAKAKLEKESEAMTRRLQEAEGGRQKLTGEMRTNKALLKQAAHDAAWEKSNNETLVVALNKFLCAPPGEEKPPGALAGEWWPCMRCGSACPEQLKFCTICGNRRPKDITTARAKMSGTTVSKANAKGLTSTSSLPALDG